LSSEIPEPSAVRALPPSRRALLFALIGLGIDIDAVGHAAAPLIGINQTDLICLSVLLQRGSITAGQLSSVVGLTTGATTTVIDRLERAGYVRRTNDPADRRKVLLEASPDAAIHAFALFDGLMESLAGLVGRYSEDQLAMLADLLEAFRGQIADFTADLRTRGAQAKAARRG
jgi:DNA-binding MarR family transcriptional regulator